MRILVLCHDIPSPTFSDTLPVYHFIKSLHSDYNHDIKLICFDSGKTKINNDIEINTVKFKENNNIYSEFFTMFFNMFRYSNLKHKFKSKTFPNLLDYYFDSEMNKKIVNALEESEYDLIYLTRPMANYVTDLDISKVIQPYDAVYKWHEQTLKATKGFKKLFYKISYILTKYYEKNIYKKFDVCIVVTETDKKSLKFLNPDLNIIVIPNGVNTEYFKPIYVKEEFPSLIYVSDMSSNITATNILHFYNNIFPLIREKVPEVKLYLVGRNPIEDIKVLSSDPSVVVTGYVEDVRPYLAKSSIFIAPMIFGTGIKNKVLEAMSMGKCVVTSKKGAQGIIAVNNKDIIVVDDKREFAMYVVELLHNKLLRKTIGNNARTIIQTGYSWTKITEKLNNVFLDLFNKKNI